MNESVETFILFFNNKGVHCATLVSSKDTSIFQYTPLVKYYCPKPRSNIEGIIIIS